MEGKREAEWRDILLGIQDHRQPPLRSHPTSGWKRNLEEGQKSREIGGNKHTGSLTKTEDPR